MSLLVVCGGSARWPRHDFHSFGVGLRGNTAINDPAEATFVGARQVRDARSLQRHL